MGMLGVSYPKFVYDRGGASEATVLLPYSQYKANDSETRYIEHESEIDLNREAVKLGTHKVIELDYLLYKEVDPSAKYTEINAYHGLKVTFYLHEDGAQYKQADDSDALFVLKEVTPYEDEVYRDYCKLVFESLNPIGAII